MQRSGMIRSGLILLAGLMAGSPKVSSLEIEPGIGVGLLFTDNARLSAENEEEDLILVGYAGVRIKENTGPFRMNAEADLIHLNYTRDTFSDQNYPGLGLTGGWEQIRDRLDWKVQNYFSQTLIDSLDGTTPDNIQNTNAFTFGPDIRFPISDRQTLTVRPEYRNFYFEILGSDNQQYALSADWSYKMYPTLRINLTGSATDVIYSNDSFSSESAIDYTRSSAYAGLSGTSARSVYSLNLGYASLTKDDFGNTGGIIGDMTWLYKLSGRSSARLYVASNITDAGNLLLDSQTNPDDGDFSNVQISDEALRNNIVRLTYGREGATLHTEIWGEFRDLEYGLEESDREVWDIGANLDYHATPLLTAGISGRYTRTRETDDDHRNNRYSITGTVSYRLTRKLRTSFDLRYQKQDSEGGLSSEFSEFSTFVRLIYGFARVERPTRGR